MVDALPELFTLRHAFQPGRKPPSERVVKRGPLGILRQDTYIPKIGPLGILRSVYPRGVPKVFHSPMPPAFEDDED